MKQPNVSCLVLSRRLMREVQIVADRIPHKHKYSYGTELRSLTMKVWTLLNLAWQSKTQRAVYLEQASNAMDELKQSLQLGVDIKAYSVKKYSELWRLAEDLGNQIGGWKKNYPIGQNPVQQLIALLERASILSTPAASSEATR